MWYIAWYHYFVCHFILYCYGRWKNEIEVIDSSSVCPSSRSFTQASKMTNFEIHPILLQRWSTTIASDPRLALSFLCVYDVALLSRLSTAKSCAVGLVVSSTSNFLSTSSNTIPSNQLTKITIQAFFTIPSLQSWLPCEFVPIQSIANACRHVATRQSSRLLRYRPAEWASPSPCQPWWPSLCLP